MHAIHHLELKVTSKLIKTTSHHWFSNISSDIFTTHKVTRHSVLYYIFTFISLIYKCPKKSDVIRLNFSLSVSLFVSVCLCLHISLSFFLSVKDSLVMYLCAIGHHFSLNSSQEYAKLSLFIPSSSFSSTYMVEAMEENPLAINS